MSIESALQGVIRRLRAAEQAAGRAEGSVTLLAVSKTFPAEAVRADLALEWHFIGPLQSNKSRAVAEQADWVHSIDRLKIAERLSAQRPAGLPPLQVCVQVNVSGEASKSGVAPAEAPALARAVAALPGLRLRGLMCIPEPTADREKLAGQFRCARELLAQLVAEGLPLDTLSMGMSADLELAVAEGATLVRVGTAIFGARDYSH